MNTEFNNTPNLEYGHATSFAEPILVKMVLPDGRKPVIGHVLQDWNNEDAPVVYVCIGEDGEEIRPPTDDWCEAEKAFERYSKHYEERQLEALLAERASRVNEIKGIRKGKGRETRTLSK